MNHIPTVVIAAPASGSGKSLVASGLMAAFARKMVVQGYKVGPDYIDPMYHTTATHRPSRNLDTWMLPRAAVLQSFFTSSQHADLAIVEGVMGLFDGFDSGPLNGSTAEVVQLLRAPLILVVDCARMAGSAAAVVHGFRSFLPDLHLSGVICNRVGSEKHAHLLEEAIGITGIPVLGCIPRLPDLVIPERHLGLFTVDERPQAVVDFLLAAADTMEKYLQLDAILQLASTASTPAVGCSATEQTSVATTRLAVARDEAFCFYYEDNFDLLRQAGTAIIPFSPLHDAHLPDDIGGLYLGGGYPELYAEKLSANQSMLKAIRSAHAAGMPIYAECGGLMYLTEGLHQAEGDYPLAGLVPGWCEMGAHLKMGYREVQTLHSGLLGEAGQTLRGHEFHYSDWICGDSDRAVYRAATRGATSGDRLDGYCHGNLQASYIHLHFGQNPQLAARLTQACQGWLCGGMKR